MSKPIGTKWKCIITICLLGLGSFVLWLAVIEPIRERLRLHRDVSFQLNQLVHYRPPHISRAKWEFTVGWTISGEANCIYSNSIPLEQIKRFSDELRVMTQSRIDELPIDWIWDEIERIGFNGAEYSRLNRPTNSNRLKDTTEECFKGL